MATQLLGLASLSVFREDAIATGKVLISELTYFTAVITEPEESCFVSSNFITPSYCTVGLICNARSVRNIITDITTC